MPCSPSVLLPQFLLWLLRWWLLDSREVKFGEIRLRGLEDVTTQHKALPLMLRVHKEVVVQGTEEQFPLLA